ncbi:MAG: sigma-70 family RNA polymerase sigma factor [Planctomycetes bacterium]|nr:sigma-70 family RNA polymerase sigma factor [Planctomycetota bacterium]
MAEHPAPLSVHFLADRARLFAYAYALVRSRAAADDLVQDAWLALAQAEARGEAIADLAGWCRGVVRNLALRHWQERRRIQALPPAELLDRIDAAFAEADAAGDEELLRALARCRALLPAPARALIELRYGEDLPMRAIAERIRRSERAVITALAKVRRRLQDCIDARLAETGHG